MSHYLFVTVDFGGDLVPFINLALEAKNAGMRITFAVRLDRLAAIPPLYGRIQEFDVLDTEGNDELIDPISSYLPSRRLLSKFVAKNEVDLILVHPAMEAGIDVAEAYDVPFIIISPFMSIPWQLNGSPPPWALCRARYPALHALFWRWEHYRFLRALAAERKKGGFAEPKQDRSEMRRLDLSIWGLSEPPASGVPLWAELVGPMLSARFEQPIAAPLKEWLDRSGPVIYIATGSVFSMLEEEYRTIIAGLTAPWRVLLVNRHIPEGIQTFIHQTHTTLEDQGRFAVVDWAPQQQVLAHPNIKVFISHCGQASVCDALYHGKPVLAVPIQWDQFYVAQRVNACGFGRSLSGSFSAKDVTATVRFLLEDQEVARQVAYYQSIVRHSGGVQRALDLCRQEVRFGSRHLHPSSPRSIFTALLPYGTVIACTLALGLLRRYARFRWLGW